MLCAASQAHAEIYVYRDGKGVRHFTNAPTSEQYRIFTAEPGTPSFGPWAGSTSYDHLIAEAARKTSLPFHLIKAVIHAESCFDPRARSKKGARGLMQIMPDTAALMRVENPFDPRDNIMGGASYLKAMLTRFNGDLQLALAAYNAGPSAVERYNNNIPPYEETQEYVRKVMKFVRYYKNI